MRRIGMAAALAALTAFATVGVVAADHSHDLITPGTAVVDIGAGQTAKCENEPGGHQFHRNFHLGTPGTVAFAQGGQVSVIKTQSASC